MSYIIGEPILNENEKKILRKLSYTPIPVHMPVPGRISITTSPNSMYDIYYRKNLNYKIKEV